MFRKIFLFTLFLAFYCVPSIAGESTADKGVSSSDGSVSGTVKDTAGAVLQGAQLVLQPTTTTVTSDARGVYLIPNLKPGSYTVTISYIGFTAQTSTITVTAGQTTLLDATLSVSSTSQQIEVTAELEGDAAAINEQRVSDNILDVQTDTQIQSLPNANIADALGRMPGVTLQRNEGEGQYVQIRGTEPRLTKLRISSPAPISSIRDSASSTTTSRPRSGPRVRCRPPSP